MPKNPWVTRNILVRAGRGTCDWRRDVVQILIIVGLAHPLCVQRRTMSAAATLVLSARNLPDDKTI
jgi:hypothetical protein